MEFTIIEGQAIRFSNPDGPHPEETLVFKLTAGMITQQRVKLEIRGNTTRRFDCKQGEPVEIKLGGCDLKFCLALVEMYERTSCIATFVVTKGSIQVG